MLRPGNLGPRGRGALARGFLVHQLRGLPGGAGRDPVPAGGGRQGRVRAHPERVGAGAPENIRHAPRVPPDRAGNRAPSGGAPPVLGRRSRDRAPLRPRPMAEARTPAPRAARPMSYKMYLFLAIVALMAALVLHSIYLISRLNAETQSLCTVLARFFAVSTFRAAEDPTLRPIFHEVIGSINFPIILTDTRNIPRAWKLIGIEPSAVPDSVLRRAAETGIIPPVVKRIQSKAQQLDRGHPPIKVERLGNPGILGYVHYGEPPLVEQLRWVPYIEFGVILALLVFGFVGFRTLMTGEQRSLWAALAKETAHQLGTPISSLLGWSAHLREAASAKEPAPDR